MKIMYVKNHSDECPKNFDIFQRGAVACCNGMQTMLTNRVQRDEWGKQVTVPVLQARAVHDYDDDDTRIVTPNVEFTYGINMPYNEQKVCPFCGHEHEAVEVQDMMADAA